MLMSNISPRSRAMALEEATFELCILKGYESYWWLRLSVRTFLKMSKWHKYQIIIFKFESDLQGKNHHFNFSYLRTGHLDKTNNLGLTGASRGQFSESEHKTNKNRQCHLLCGMKISRYGLSKRPRITSLWLLTTPKCTHPSPITFLRRTPLPTFFSKKAVCWEQQIYITEGRSSLKI